MNEGRNKAKRNFLTRSVREREKDRCQGEEERGREGERKSVFANWTR